MPETNPTADMAAALASFQDEMPTVHKGQTARIPGKEGRSGYSYQYADLADVAKVAHPLLARHGLSFTTRPRHLEGVGFVLEGVLRHSGGAEDVGCLPITGRSAQDLGSSLTYLRRYLLGCMTGIVTDDDEDGGLATEAGTERPQAQTPQAYAPPPEDTAEKAEVRRLLGTCNPEEKANLQAWWAQAADHGAMPPLDNWGALTPGHVGQVTEALGSIRETLAIRDNAADPH